MTRGGAAEPSLEETLIKRCKDRDLEAFGVLVDLYQSRVYGFVRRMIRSQEDTEDISQEVFVKAFQNISRFDGRASLATWLFRIATNLCIDKLRRKDRRPEQVPMMGEGDAEFDLADARYDPVSMAVSREMEKTIEAAILGLSDKLKPVLLLHDLEGLSYEDIARILGVPIGTVKSRLFLARTRLQEALANYMYPGATT